MPHERDPLLDQAYRAGAAEQPPPRLDAAILAAARREVEARPRAVGSGWRAWRVPVSIAAVVVLSVSLATLVREEEDRLARVAPPGAGSGDSVASPSAPAAPGAAGPAFRPQGERGAPVAAPPRAGSGTAEERADAGAPIAKAPATVPGQATPAEAPPGTGGEVAPERRLMAAAPPAVSPKEDSAGTPATAVAADSARTERVETPARARVAAREAPRPVWEGYEEAPPRKWLERIAELKRQQRLAEAEAMLAEFKRRYPGYSLPAPAE